MGLERIINFVNRNLSYNIINEIFLNNNTNKILAENIFFDFNFFIYLNLGELEDEINDIIKIIHSLTFTKIDKLIEKLELILEKNHWKIFKDDLINILDGSNEDKIINDFKNFLNSKKEFKKKIVKILDKSFNKNLTILDLLIFLKIYYFVKKMLDSIHHIEFIQNIFIFFDGIPSYSKILEQRRRRTKNYLESNIRKEYFKENFSKMMNDIHTENGISYNYFNWLDNKFSIDKSFGPSSELILNLELFLKKFYKNNKLEEINYNLHICSGKIFGESDFKIFKYISQKNIKNNIFIHTCDSDFLHLILVQQCYYNIFQKSIKYNIIRYYSKDSSSVQFISAEKIIKDILRIYCKIYKNDDNNYLKVLDFLFLCYFFGNDHLPGCNWFGPELSLEEIFILLKNSIDDKNLIKYNDKKKVEIDWNNLLDFLIELKNSKKIEIIKLQKNFKLQEILISFIKNNSIDNNFFCKDIIPKYLSYLGSKNNFDYNDWRNIFYKKLKISENPFDNYDLESKKKNLLEKNINEWLNFVDFNFCKNNKDNYLPYFTKGLLISNENSYQDLYIYVCQISLKESQKNYSLFYKNNNNKENSVEEYLIFLNYCVNNFFKDICSYNPCNFNYYKYLSVPDLDEFINFLKNSKSKKLSENFNKKILDKFTDKKNYFDKLSHHLFITPYLLESSFFEQVRQYPNLEKILLELSKIDNLWINLKNANKFNFRKLDSLDFLKKWFEIIKKFDVNVNKEVKF